MSVQLIPMTTTVAAPAPPPPYRRTPPNSSPRQLTQRFYTPPHIYKHQSAILLELCTSLEELRQFMPPIFKHDFYNQHLFQTKLVSLFCNYGSVHEAARVFESVDDKLDVLYHTLLKGYAKNSSFDEALNFFCRMRYDDVSPVVYNFTYLLKMCGDDSDLERGKELHGLLITNGFGSNMFAMTGIVNMYAKCRQVNDAYKMFDRMPERDVVSWNTVIAGYAQNGMAKIALELVLRMQEEERKRPDSITIITILPAVADMGSLMIGKSVHGYVLRSGFEPLVNISTALVDMYGKCGSVETARMIFNKMDKKTVVSWNSMIDGYVQSGNHEEAIETFEILINEGVEPTDVTIMEALHACAGLGDLEKGMSVHKLIDGLKLENIGSVMNSLITMYCKCKRVDLASDIFEKMHNKTLVSWNSMILGYAQNGRAYDALKYFSKMRSQNIKPDSFTLVSVIPALAELSILRYAKWAHGLVTRMYLDKNVYVMTALIDMYAKCGSVHKARKLFNTMVEKHVTTWNAMIDGYGMHGHGKAAVELFEEMRKGMIKPNDITFLCIISACSHSGLAKEGLNYFTIMKQDYDLEPSMDHYGAMVDLLGRAGRLTEAWDFIQNMLLEPGISVYGAMLGACKIHKNVDLGEKAAKKLFDLRPNEGGYHVLLTNIYATSSMWDKVLETRKLMEKNGLYKTPGFSSLELRNEVHTFYSGSTSHPQSKKIYAFLETLRDRIKEIGYVCDTNPIHDVENGVKEKLLNSHSEKLAIAFGLLNTNHGVTLHIRKNLRVCGDCHNATKYISLVTGREIVVRDMHRFHHFKNGVCSCGDYW